MTGPMPLLLIAHSPSGVDSAYFFDARRIWLLQRFVLIVQQERVSPCGSPVSVIARICPPCDTVSSSRSRRPPEPRSSSLRRVRGLEPESLVIRVTVSKCS